MTNETFTVTLEGRTWALTAETTPPTTEADLRGRGWDGLNYIGVSKPTGRQRKTIKGLFFRNMKTNEFSLAFKA